MNRKGLLIVVSGPSGVGKGTLCNLLMERENNIVLSISHTTRKPREGEIHGKNYFFRSKEDFNEDIQRNAFLEYAEVYGNFYGTPLAAINDNINNGIDTLLEIDTQGAIEVRRKFPDAVAIFIMPPSRNKLADRLINRKTDSEDSIKQRLSCLDMELSKLPKYDYAVVNDDLEQALTEIRSIIYAEHSNLKRNLEYYRGLV